jgi:hypothetical protein
MLGGVDSEPRSTVGRRLEIAARLGAIRARLEELREREREKSRSRASGWQRPIAGRPRRTLLPG